MKHGDLKKNRLIAAAQSEGSVSERSEADKISKQS